MTHELALRCHSVMKEFATEAGPVRVLKGVTLTARAGELTMLVGPSGCGKTTLLTIIAGLLQPTSGAVHLFNRPLTAMGKGELLPYRLHHIGFIFQQYNLIQSLTAVENAAVPLVAAGQPWPEAICEAQRELDRLGMTEHVHKLPRHLSGGQQQRVAIARALVHQPRLLLCDEPTAALDARAGLAVVKLLRETAVKTDRVVLVVTHDSRIHSFADQIVTMDDGVIVRVEPSEGKQLRQDDMSARETSCEKEL